MWGVLGQSGRCAGSSADWPFSAGMTNEAPLSRRLARHPFVDSNRNPRAPLASAAEPYQLALRALAQASALAAMAAHAEMA